MQLDQSQKDSSSVSSEQTFKNEDGEGALGALTSVE